MSRASIEKRLVALSQEITVHRRELAVLDEQLQHFADCADDARLRSLVSETPLAAGEHREAAKAVAGIRKDKEVRLKKLAKLESMQDDLLDQLGGAES